MVCGGQVHQGVGGLLVGELLHFANSAWASFCACGHQQATQPEVTVGPAGVELDGLAQMLFGVGVLVPGGEDDAEVQIARGGSSGRA